MTPPIKTLRMRAGTALMSTVMTALATPAAQASEPAPAPPLWELGIAGLAVSQQAYPGSDQRLGRALVLPYAMYRGRVLRADRETAGLRALRTERFELDLGVAASFGGGSDEIEARQGMRRLGTLLEAGPRLKWRLGADPARSPWRLELPLRGVFDLSDGARQRGLVFEPELVFERGTAGGWRYKTAASTILADRRLAAHFYRVDAAEATATRPAYDARGGLLAWRASLSAGRSLSPDWRVVGFARLDTVHGAANEDSPLVRRKSGGTVGIGLFWTGLRSQAPAWD